MQKTISYKGFNSNGDCIAELKDSGRYTVRGAMRYLSERGWKPIEKLGEGRKLRYCWYIEDEATGVSINATIV